MKVALASGLGFLLGGGIFMVSRVGHALQLPAVGEELTLRTPTGDWRVERPNEVGPGLPVYPDAKLVLPGQSVRPAAPKNNQAPAQTAIYYTNDPSEFVGDWYMNHLGSEFVRSNFAARAIPDAPSDLQISDTDITFVGERGDQVRIVTIAADPTGAKITLVRYTKRKVQ
jgi:hypothetical protein